MALSNLDEWVEAAAEAAGVGARILLASRGKIRAREKNRFDLVTDADLACQHAIQQSLHGRFPDHQFIMEEAEERQSRGQTGRPTWIVDPIDGTTNYVHDLPGYCISIGLLVDDQLSVGVVYDPWRGEMFQAALGRGAWLGGQKLSVSSTDRLEHALLASEAPYSTEDRGQTFRSWQRLSLKSQGVRQLGATALDLAYVAAGRLDGFWGTHDNHAWDLAAGAVLIREAGGRVSNLDGNELDIFIPDMLASNGRIHRELRAVLNHGSEGDK
jgi:myo-inositol-1(or 4)-monophosphatase